MTVGMEDLNLDLSDCARLCSRLASRQAVSSSSPARPEASKCPTYLAIVSFRSPSGTLRAMTHRNLGVQRVALQALRLHLEEATVYAFEFRPVAQSGPA